jgi:hypothetical protein
VFARVFVEPSGCINTGSKTMSYAAAKRRASRRGALVGPSKRLFYKTKLGEFAVGENMTFDKTKMGLQGCLSGRL